MRRQKLKDDFEGYWCEYELAEDINFYEKEYMETMRDYIEFYELQSWEEMLVRN